MTKDGTALALDSAQLLQSLFALIPVPIAIVDNRGRIVLANSSFNDVFQGVTNVPMRPQHELEVHGRGTFKVQTLPLNEQGLKMVFASDVTDEAQLRQQVTHLEKMAAIGRVVTGVAHELNNPLADIVSYVPLIAKCNLEPEPKQIVDVVFSRAERAGHLVQNLLILAGITAPKYVSFDLNEVVRNVVELRNHRTPGQRFEVKVDLDPAIPRAIGDPAQIEQVVLTLLINAEDAVSSLERRPGTIQLRTAARAGRLQLHVSDNGHTRDAARVFEPHQNGVGLNICSEIVKDHGGELYAWSAYGNGSTFTLELPVQAVDEDASGTVGNIGQCLRGKTVMMIDDEVQITELVHDVLSRHGAAVHVAHSGADAYPKLRSGNYDLIICDENMPGLSGQSLYRLVESGTPSVNNRFLFVTGDAVSAQTRQFFLKTGVQFLRKPFRIHDLLESIESLLNRNQRQGS